MASSLSHTRRCVAAIGFGAAPHYNLITIHLLWQDCVKAPPRLVPPRRREIKLADAQLKHFTFLRGRHSSPFTSEPERACINVEVFINGVKINASLKSIATWEPVHRLPIDRPTLISLIHLIAPDVLFFFRSLRNWRLVVFSWVLRLEFYYFLISLSLLFSYHASTGGDATLDLQRENIPVCHFHGSEYLVDLVIFWVKWQ